MEKKLVSSWANGKFCRKLTYFRLLNVQVSILVRRLAVSRLSISAILGVVIGML